MNALPHFWFYLRTGTRNAFARWLKRLRSPKYAFALIVGIAYFFFALGGPSLFQASQATADRHPFAVLGQLAPFMLVIIVGNWWLSGASRFALAFSPAEVNFLFTAPLTRTQLINFKLLRSQVTLLFTAFIIALVGARAPGPWWLRFLSAWLLFGTLQLHQIAAELVHANARQHGRTGWRRIWLPALLFSATVVILVTSVIQSVQKARAENTAIWQTLLDETSRAPASWVLAPFQAVVAPFNATTFADWLPAFLLGLLLWAAHYFWVIRADVAFEEASAEASARVAELRDAMRAGRRPSLSARPAKSKIKKPWFKLPPAGEPAVGLVWKNVLHFTRSLSLFVPIIVLLAASFIGTMAYLEERSITAAFTAAGAILLAIGGALFLFGPLAFRNDLRMDLKNIELLRTLPVTGVRMIAAQIAGSTFALTFTQLFFLLPGTILLLLGWQSVPAGRIAGVAVGVIVALPAINAITLTIQNALALLYPGWTTLGAQRPGGIEHMGQQILTTIGGAALLVLALIGPLIVGAIGAGIMWPVWAERAYIPGVAFFIAGLYAEAVVFFQLLGPVYDRLDPVEAGLIK